MNDPKMVRKEKTRSVSHSEVIKKPETRMNRYAFAIGNRDGTWREELVDSDTIIGAQSKIYNMYPNETHPEISFRVFLKSVELVIPDAA